MAEGKVDLPDDLLSLKSTDEPWTAKDEASGGNDEERVMLGFVDESKEQLNSDNSIPLSPQWLYAKPSESKAVLSAVSGDTRPSNCLPHLNSADLTQKDVWRLDGSQEKKDWRRNVPDIESGRRWREEERETGLLARRDRRKEGDRENEFRKSERRADNASVRESIDARAIPLSDRWHDVNSRNSVHEMRRDSKWSSRWGPEDRDKDARAEKRMDTEKDDTYSEKQSFVGSNRVVSERETDSRDKWRPRHRVEVHSASSTAYRAAPGFGLDRGRLEGSSLGFAPGRGRSNIIGSVPFSGPLLVGPIGAAPMEKNESGHVKPGLSADTFCYPRGKLLDIYRKHTLSPSLGFIPERLQEVQQITQLDPVEPLAFVAPDVEEEAVLEDIWKGKITSSGVNHNSSRDRTGMLNDNGVENATVTESTVPASNTDNDALIIDGAISFDASQANPLDVSEKDANLGLHERKVATLIEGTISGDSAPVASKFASVYDIQGLGSSDSNLDPRIVEARSLNTDEQMGSSIFLKHAMFQEADPVSSFDTRTKLPNDASFLFDLPSLQEIPSVSDQCLENNGEVKPLECSILPEELSLFYQDPQGDIQGPFLGVDIISWFDQGFFGADLPVRLSDAPEGTPFQDLGEVMPHLILRGQSPSDRKPSDNLELSGKIEGKMEALTLDPEFPGSELKSALHHPVQTSKQDALEHLYGRLQLTDLESSASILNAERQNFHELASQDDEEILFSRRPGSSSGNPGGKPAGNIHDPLGNPSSMYFLSNEMGDTSIHQVSKSSSLHPLGLQWSELEAPHLQHAQLANMSSGIGDHSHKIDPAGNFHDPLANPSSMHFLANEMGDTSFLKHQVKSSSLHPLGLQWSELEGPHLQHAQLANMSSRIGDYSHKIDPALGREAPHYNQRQNSVGAFTDTAVGETWPDIYKRNMLRSHDIVPDALDFRHLSHLEEGSNRFDLAEHLHLQQLQKHQQLQQQKLLCPHPNMHLGGSVLEQLPGAAVPHSLHPSQHQQSIVEADPEHFLKLQLHKEHQYQLQQQQRQLQMQQSQQQLHHHQMQLQQLQHQKQSQVRQLMLEQFLHQQMHNPSFGQQRVDPLRSNNVLDQVLLRQQHLSELHPRSHFSLRQQDPSLEQLIQAKFGPNLRREHPNDLLELLSQAKHGQMLTPEQKLLLSMQQEQLKAREFLASRQQQDASHAAGVWSIDESSQFLRTTSNPHHALSVGFEPLDSYQGQTRPHSFEQLGHPERDLALNERLQRGLYEPSSLLGDRSVHMPARTPEMNVELSKTLARLQGVEMQERHPQMHLVGPMGLFSSDPYTHHPQVNSNHFHDLKMEPIDTRWSECNGQRLDGWVETQVHQSNLERQRRQSEVNFLSEDVRSWGQAVGNGDMSKQMLMDLLHQKLGQNSTQSLEIRDNAPMSSNEMRETSHIFSATVMDQSSELPMGQEGLIDSFVELREAFPEDLVNVGMEGRPGSVEGSERLTFTSNSETLIEDDQLHSVMDERVQASYTDPSMIKSSVDISEMKDGKKGKKRGSKSKGANKLALEAQQNSVEQAVGAVTDHGGLPVISPVRHTSLGSTGVNAGLYNYEMEMDEAFSEEMTKDRAPTLLSKGLDGSALKCQNVSRAFPSQEALLEFAAAPTVKGKNVTNNFSDEARRDSRGDPTVQVAEASSAGKKDVRAGFRRTSSFSDAETMETSFIDMLKSTKKPVHESDCTAVSLEALEASQTTRSGKKKGKKGRQIDPALLGFKVSSNRIMMGEIQRLED